MTSPHRRPLTAGSKRRSLARSPAWRPVCLPSLCLSCLDALLSQDDQDDDNINNNDESRTRIRWGKVLEGEPSDSSRRLQTPFFVGLPWPRRRLQSLRRRNIVVIHDPAKSTSTLCKSADWLAGWLGCWSTRWPFGRAGGRPLGLTSQISPNFPLNPAWQPTEI